MAGTYATEQQRVIDRIKCIAFRETMDSGPTFIDKKTDCGNLEDHSIGPLTVGISQQTLLLHISELFQLLMTQLTDLPSFFAE